MDTISKQEDRIAELESGSVIKVRVEEDRFGSITVTPISNKYSKISFYIQVDWQIQEFLEEYPKARYGRKNEYGNYDINDGKVFLMEADRFWDYYSCH
jgi:hypothetical protein